MGVWRICQKLLSPIQSPLASFVYHPRFKEATSTFNFERWSHAGMDKLGKLGFSRGVIIEDQVIMKIGRFPGQRYQYMQVRHFLNELLTMTDVFHPLTAFERFLELGPFKKSLSTVYQMLLLQDKVTDWTHRA